MWVGIKAPGKGISKLDCRWKTVGPVAFLPSWDILLSYLLPVLVCRVMSLLFASSPNLVQLFLVAHLFPHSPDYPHHSLPLLQHLFVCSSAPCPVAELVCFLWWTFFSSFCVSAEMNDTKRILTIYFLRFVWHRWQQISLKPSSRAPNATLTGSMNKKYRENN